MSDLISRQAAIDAVMELVEEEYEWRSGVSRKISLLNAVYCALEDIPSAQPTIEAEPVRHGKWLWVDGVRCSECNYKLQTTGLPSYCPSCGADMRGESE
jgi:predicted Zn-ribbon and HTH transcriptional regulator